jgi:hypothetical protein
MTEILCTLSVLSKRLPADRITTCIGVAPDSQVVQGADRVPPRPVPRANGWYLMQSGNDPELAPIVRNLLARVPSIPDALKRLRDVDPDLEVVMSAAISPMNAKVALFLDADLVAKLARMGAATDIEFFPNGPIH